MVLKSEHKRRDKISVQRVSPDSVAGAAVTPAALHLPEARDAALFPAQTAARPVDELHAWLRVHGEVQEETHDLSVRQDAGLSRTWAKRRNTQQKTKTKRMYNTLTPSAEPVTHTCGELLDGHEREADEAEGFTQHTSLVLWCGLQLLPVGFSLRPTDRRPEQSHLPHAQRVSLQHRHQSICDKHMMR